MLGRQDGRNGTSLWEMMTQDMLHHQPVGKGVGLQLEKCDSQTGPQRQHRQETRETSESGQGDLLWAERGRLQLERCGRKDSRDSAGGCVRLQLEQFGRRYIMDSAGGDGHMM